MSTGTGWQLRTDPITLEVLRHRLEAIGEEGANTIERTAISPVVTESKDYSCTILDREGGLLIGAGKIDYHFYAASSAVNATIAAHGASIVAGDVFLANDPHNGGGLHAQDVMVQRPVFVDGARVAWIVNSAHLMDMGGMVLGSWAPAATECFQEALRFPPVRLFRAGIENSDVWAIFRNNVRLSELVEMDLRGLVAGCHVANEKLEAVISEILVSIDSSTRSRTCVISLRRSYAGGSPRLKTASTGRFRGPNGTTSSSSCLARSPSRRHVALRLHRRGAAGATLLQLQAVHHCERARRRDLQVLGARPAVQSWRVPADHARLPAGEHREQRATRPGRRGAHGRGVQCIRGRHPGAVDGRRRDT